MHSDNRQRGFSLIELLVVMVVFSLVIVAASQTFIGILSSSKQQGRIVASNIEGMLGLEVMRRDIAHAGHGLYWSFDPKSCPTPTPSYSEVQTELIGWSMNDAPDKVPRPLVFAGNTASSMNQSDVIAVKSTNVTANAASEKYNYLFTSPVVTLNSWCTTTLSASDNISPGDWAIVVRPDDSHRYLICAAGGAMASPYQTVAASYAPDTTSMVFSLGTNNMPRMPFNRADYRIKNTSVPARCAIGTGVLYKSVVNTAMGTTGYVPQDIPLLDCVADMEVAYRFDSTGGNFANTTVDVTGGTYMPASLTEAQSIREVRVYILAQEGNRDSSYTHPVQKIWVGESGMFGREFDLAMYVTDWQRYRWKLYTMIIQPISLVQWGAI